MQSPTHIEPHQIATGDAFEDSLVNLTLVLSGPAGRREYPTTLAAALGFDNAYDHAYSSCESPDDSDGAWYEKA